MWPTGFLQVSRLSRLHRECKPRSLPELCRDGFVNVIVKQERSAGRGVFQNCAVTALFGPIGQTRKEYRPRSHPELCRDGFAGSHWSNKKAIKNTKIFEIGLTKIDKRTHLAFIRLTNTTRAKARTHRFGTEHQTSGTHPPTLPSGTYPWSLPELVVAAIFVGQLQTKVRFSVRAKSGPQ